MYIFFILIDDKIFYEKYESAYVIHSKLFGSMYDKRPAENSKKKNEWNED